MASLLNDNITSISLFSEPNVVGLYQKLGFVVDPDGVRGMAYRYR